MPRLITDNLTREQTAEGLVLEPSYLGFLRSQGYTIREYVREFTVSSESRDASHLVMQVDTYLYPKDDPLLDIANPEHQCTIWVCGCWDFRKNKSADVRMRETLPTDTQACKHIREISKVQKAKADENQQQL